MRERPCASSLQLNLFRVILHIVPIIHVCHIRDTTYKQRETNAGGHMRALEIWTKPNSK